MIALYSKEIQYRTNKHKAKPTAVRRFCGVVKIKMYLYIQFQHHRAVVTAVNVVAYTGAFYFICDGI